MTSLAVSLSVDTRGPCALYILTDSRITWPAPGQRWDSGQKTFASARFPDVFGYCGDAFFPPMMLRQLVEQLDAGVICADGDDAEERHVRFLSAMKGSIGRVTGLPPMLSFAIYHAARDGAAMSARFRLWESRYFVATRRWNDRERDIAADHSYLIQLDGSGAWVVRQRDQKWSKSDVGGTSRSAVWAFCEALQSARDPSSGGAPQLVGLFRIGAGRHFGFFWNRKPYLAGLEVRQPMGLGSVQWFNHLFERCDPATGNRLKSAAIHSKPKI